VANVSPRAAYADPTTPPQLDDSDPDRHRRQIAEAVRQILDGKVNVVKTVTLRASQTTTTVTDTRIGATSFIGLMPTTLNAAGALATTYISARTDGQATITHANTADADKTFILLILGQ
jgi:hypothetical protein